MFNGALITILKAFFTKWVIVFPKTLLHYSAKKFLTLLLSTLMSRSNRFYFTRWFLLLSRDIKNVRSRICSWRSCFDLTLSSTHFLLWFRRRFLDERWFWRFFQNFRLHSTVRIIRSNSSFILLRIICWTWQIRVVSSIFPSIFSSSSRLEWRRFLPPSQSFIFQLHSHEICFLLVKSNSVILDLVSHWNVGFQNFVNHVNTSEHFLR